MPSVSLHPRSLASSTAASVPPNPLPPLLQTPSGLAILEIQGTINVPSEHGQGHELQPEDSQEAALGSTASTFETPLGKLMFPDYSPQTMAPDDTTWMKRAYLYVGRYQRMTGEVKKLAKPLAVVQRRQQTDSMNDEEEQLEIVEIVKYRILFKNRPEPVNDA